MSFKRDGDDVDLLRKLQFRRVGDLLADHIPEDEASLLSNGRLTCLICTHRPIFDTLTMLSVHRKGKKHISELSKFLAHQRELDLHKLKVEQQSALLAEKEKPRQEKVKWGQRRAILELPSSLHTIRKPEKGQPSTTAQVRHYVKSLWRKRALEKTVERCRENYGQHMVSSTGPSDRPGPTVSISEETSASEPSAAAPTIPTTEKIVPSDNSIKKLASYELRLKMSGWVKDAHGQWAKDPNAEFDSDEEEPLGPT